MLEKGFAAGDQALYMGTPRSCKAFPSVISFGRWWVDKDKYRMVMRLPELEGAYWLNHSVSSNLPNAVRYERDDHLVKWTKVTVSGSHPLKTRLRKHAPDAGESASISRSSLRLRIFSSQMACSPPCPNASNANRYSLCLWASENHLTKNVVLYKEAHSDRIMYNIEPCSLKHSFVPYCAPYCFRHAGRHQSKP